MRKFLMTALAALAIISCEKPGSNLETFSTHSFSATEFVNGVSAKGNDGIDFNLNGVNYLAEWNGHQEVGSFVFTEGNGSIFRDYSIPTELGEYLSVEIVVQDFNPVSLTFKFYQGGNGDFYSFYFDNVTPGESTTAWTVEATNGIIDEVTSQQAIDAGMGVGDSLEGDVTLFIARADESAAGGTTKKGATLPSSSKSSDRVPEYSCNLPSLEEAADGAIAYAKRNGLSNASLQSKSWFTNAREWNQTTGSLCSRPITVELTVDVEIVYGESLCGENPINCKYTNDAQYKVYYRSLKLINGPVSIDVVMEDYGLSSMITVQQ